MLILTVILAGLSAAEIPAGKVYRKAEYDLAYKLLETMDMKKQFDIMKNGMLEMQLKAAPQLTPYKEIFVRFFEKYLVFDSLKRELADIYLDMFTPEEIKELIAFYETPLGKKIIEKTPELTLRSAQVGQNAVAKHLLELQNELRKPLRRNRKRAPRRQFSLSGKNNDGKLLCMGRREFPEISAVFFRGFVRAQTAFS